MCPERMEWATKWAYLPDVHAARIAASGQGPESHRRAWHGFIDDVRSWLEVFCPLSFVTFREELMKARKKQRFLEESGWTEEQLQTYVEQLPVRMMWDGLAGQEPRIITPCRCSRLVALGQLMPAMPPPIPPPTSER